MDPISASCFSLHIQENQRAIAEEQKQDEKFSEIIVSCKSLSRYEGRTFKTLVPQILAAIIVASYHIVVGISLAYSAILIPHVDPNNTEFRAQDGISATKAECSWIASVIVIVVPIGAITGGFFMDSIGRLNTIKMAIIPSVLGWSLIALAQNVPMIIAGRLLAGFASAWGTSPAIVYMTEIGRADLRGSLISTAPTFASLGMVICFLKGWFMHWKTVAWLSNIYAIVPCILICFIPESPAWLVSKGKIEQAAKSLRWINKYQPQPENRNESLAELQLNFLQKEHQQKLEEQTLRGSGGLAKFKEFFKPTGYKPIIILFGLFFFQQFSGIYITLFYSVTFFQDVGSTINPYLASVLIGTVRMLMSCVNTYMLRTFHRRPLIMASGLGMAICMGFSGLFTYWIKEGTSTQNWVPVVFILLYVVTSMIGLLNIPWTMTAELFPIEIRGVAQSLSYSIANLLMFLAVQSYYALDKIFGGTAGIQWFFAVVSILASIYVFIVLPETHNKKLSEITEYFVDNTIFLTSGKKKKGNPQKKVVTRAAKKDIVKSNGTSTQNWVPVLLLILYVVTSMIGLLPIPWTMTAELFPIEIRGIGHSIALSVANIIMFAAVQSYWTLNEILGGTAGVQWFFAVLSITASLYVFIVLPETHNKKLSEITEYFKYNSIYMCSEKQKKASSSKRKGVRISVNRDIVRSDDQNEKLMNSV